MSFNPTERRQSQVEVGVSLTCSILSVAFGVCKLVRNITVKIRIYIGKKDE